VSRSIELYAVQQGFVGRYVPERGPGEAAEDALTVAIEHGGGRSAEFTL